MNKSRGALILILVLSGPSAHAWGKRGHEIVASVAARLLSEEKRLVFLRDHEFDLGYYANVPDLIWRKDPVAVDAEPPTHFFDWGKDFEKRFGSVKNLPVLLSEYKSKMGKDYNRNVGLVPWRVHDLVEKTKVVLRERVSDWQIQTLIHIGTLSHYTGDSSQPLHMSENHHGQLTHQEGVHEYFETMLVDALDPQLKVDVLAKARELFKRASLTDSADVSFRKEMQETIDRIEPLLSMDKKADRKNIQKTARQFKKFIVERLASGAVYTALIWKDCLRDLHDWNEHKFYDFAGTPKYIFLKESQ